MHRARVTPEEPTVIRVSPPSRALLACLCTAAALALIPGAAHADPYVVDHCTNFDTGAPGTAFGAFTGQSADTCGSQGGALLRQQGTLGANQTVEMLLSIPADRPNIAIQHVQSRFFSPGTVPGGAAGGSFAFMSMYMQSVQLANYDVSGQAVTAAPDVGVPAPGRSLRWTIYCTTLQTCTFTNDFLLRVLSSRLTLNEGVAPTLSVTGGSLLGAGGRSGLRTVAFDAADSDSGVANATVALGSTVVGTMNFTCAYRDWSACPRELPSQLLQVDTTKVPDGNHELIVTVRDAANNALMRSLGTVTVANGPRPAVPNGGSASRLAKITARYTTTTKRSRTLRFTARPSVSGTLLDENGKPIAGATVAVLARLRQSGAADALIASATTAADGTFSLTLPSGPSRTITFAYTAFSADAKPAATAVLKTNVRALISARISPRSVRAGNSITLRGRLGLLPRRNVEVKIQARQGLTWRTIDDVRTASDGSFRWRYRFPTRQARRTYAFRARVASPIYPFAAASSKVVRVGVR
jgi:hypothetical protein